MRQLLYVSSKRRGTDISVPDILRVSQRNNRAANVTGLLYTDGVRFLQVLEGADPDVEKTFHRIKADERHHAVVLLSDRQVEAREFGHWSMTQPQADDSEDAFDARLQDLLANASDTVRGTFVGLIAARRPN